MASTSQAAASILVDVVIIKILHAHNFARTSSQALSVLSNLFSRYLVLATSACGQYAELAGRTRLSVHDVLACLDQLGTNFDELSEFCSTEGIELSKYSSSSARRVDDISEFRNHLAEGLVATENLPSPTTPSRPSSPSVSIASGHNSDTVNSEPSQGFGLDFLPSLPDASLPPSISPIPVSEPVKMERPPSPLPQPLASAMSADYGTQVPYSDSVLASAPSRHLPARPNFQVSSKTQATGLPIPSPQQALISAYHHILTHPLGQTGPANPAKHKVAMSLLSQIQTNTRWNSPDTLYGNIVPCSPRVSAISASYPIPMALLEDIRAGKEVDEKKCLLPPLPPRSVFSSDKPVFLASQQASRLPELSRQVLPGPVLARITRLSHPPVLQRGSQKLIYGHGISAPWNSSAQSGQTLKGGDDTTVNGRDAPSFTLPDAQLFTTWDYEVKHYQDSSTGRRGRMIGVAHPPKRTPLA